MAHFSLRTQNGKRAIQRAKTSSSSALLVICITSSTFIFCPFGELGLRPFNPAQGRRRNAFTGGQAFLGGGRSERVARGLPLGGIGGETSALVETVSEWVYRCD